MPPSTTSKVTTDHEEIRRWAEERDATPAAAIRGESDDGAGIIRLDVPGDNGGGQTEELGWDEWFNKLDKHKLALLYQEHTAGGENSNFNQIVSRKTAEEAHSAVGGKGRSAAHKRAEKSAKKAPASGSNGSSRSTRKEAGPEGTTRKSGSARGASRQGSTQSSRSSGSRSRSSSRAPNRSSRSR